MAVRVSTETKMTRRDRESPPIAVAPPRSRLLDRPQRRQSGGTGGGQWAPRTQPNTEPAMAGRSISTSITTATNSFTNTQRLYSITANRKENSLTEYEFEVVLARKSPMTR